MVCSALDLASLTSLMSVGVWDNPYSPKHDTKIVFAAVNSCRARSGFPWHLNCLALCRLPKGFRTNAELVGLVEKWLTCKWLQWATVLQHEPQLPCRARRHSYDHVLHACPLWPLMHHRIYHLTHGRRSEFVHEKLSYPIFLINKNVVHDPKRMLIFLVI